MAIFGIMKKLLLSILLFAIFFESISQNSTITQSINHSKIVLTENKDIWRVTLQNREMPNPDGLSEKAKLAKLKRELSIKYPRKTSKEIFEKSTDSIPTIKIENGFEGNTYNNRIPNDNTLAISNNGIIAAGINSTYLFYDSRNDSVIDQGTLHSFTAGFPQFNTVSKYDPKFIYDPNEDRFIVTFLIGTAYQNSHICVAFSSSNNPLDPWNVYLLSGNPLGTDHWTDYPAISLTKDELFITGNLLANGVSWQIGFQQSLIWQIDKYDGYSGESDLDMQIWSDIIDDTIALRNIHPAKGARELTGPNQYLLSNKNFSAESDTLYMIEITNTLNSGEASINLTKFSLSDHYFLSPNGQQSISKELATNDSRVLGAIIDDEWIQYVHHSMDTAYGTSGIYHGIIENYSSTPSVSGKIISDSIIDFGYPNIASTGINPNEKECIIGFNYTSPIDTNGIACFYMNNSSIYSERNILKRGDAPINSFISGNVDRWGDYFGIQRYYSEPCKVWMSGMFGKNSNNGSWISNVAVSDTCRTPDPIITIDPPFSDGSLFPNPAIDWVTFDFTLDETMMVLIELYDIQGKLIKELYNDSAKEGENRLTFNGYSLEAGVYFIRVSSNKNSLFTKKLIKNNSN